MEQSPQVLKFHAKRAGQEGNDILLSKNTVRMIVELRQLNRNHSTSEIQSEKERENPNVFKETRKPSRCLRRGPIRRTNSDPESSFHAFLTQRSLLVLASRRKFRIVFILGPCSSFPSIVGSFFQVCKNMFKTEQDFQESSNKVASVRFLCSGTSSMTTFSSPDIISMALGRGYACLISTMIAKSAHWKTLPPLTKLVVFEDLQPLRAAVSVVMGSVP